MGPLLFDINLLDIYHECEETGIASYTVNTTPHSCAFDTQAVILELNIISNKLFHWFKYNHFKVNPGKGL